MKSQQQIIRERKAWARGKVTVAWLTVAKVVEDPSLTLEQLHEHDRAMRDAIAIAQEWTLDPDAIVDELTASEMGKAA